jgi:hypothetical protein
VAAAHCGSRRNETTIRLSWYDSPTNPFVFGRRDFLFALLRVMDTLCVVDSFLIVESSICEEEQRNNQYVNLGVFQKKTRLLLKNNYLCPKSNPVPDEKNFPFLLCCGLVPFRLYETTFASGFLRHHPATQRGATE